MAGPDIIDCNNEFLFYLGFDMDEKEVAVLLAVIILLLLATTIVILIVVFCNKKNSLIEEKSRELNKAQIEIREETLRNISWELHDNIGQLMTLAKINAQMAVTDPSKIESVISTIDSSLKQLRLLSRAINPSFIKNLKLVDALKLELERYNRLDFLKSSITINGNVFLFDLEQETILFRIIQEFFTNSIRHSKATELNVELNYKNGELEIFASDNGVGFSVEKTKGGIGMHSMKNRAELIGAKFKLESTPNIGTKLCLKYRN